MNTNIKAIDNENYWSLSILALLIPLVGLVLGVVYLTKESPVDRKLGEHLVATSILFMIVWSLVVFLFFAHLQATYLPAIQQ